MPDLFKTWDSGKNTDHGELTGLEDDDHPQYVETTGNETIGGIKTFSSVPVLPASNPTTDNQAVRKAYVDALVGATIPAARVYNSTNIAIPHNTDTVLTFNSERYDTDSIHSTTSNTSRLVCKTPGVYSITGHVRWLANATGDRVLDIIYNGVKVIARIRRDAMSASFSISIATQMALSVNDYVELRVNQRSGGDLNVLASAMFSPEFTMTWLGAAE